MWSTGTDETSGGNQTKKRGGVIACIDMVIRYVFRYFCGTYTE